MISDFTCRLRCVKCDERLHSFRSANNFHHSTVGYLIFIMQTNVDIFTAMPTTLKLTSWGDSQNS